MVYKFLRQQGIVCKFSLDSQISHLMRYDFEQMNRIKEVLKEKELKQTWLAEKMGKSYNMVNSYVQNRRQPSLEDLNRIANILEVDVKDLIVSNRK